MSVKTPVVPQTARGSLKSSSFTGGAHLQSGGSDDLLLGIPLAAGDLDGNQLTRGCRHLRE